MRPKHRRSVSALYHPNPSCLGTAALLPTGVSFHFALTHQQQLAGWQQHSLHCYHPTVLKASLAPCCLLPAGLTQLRLRWSQVGQTWCFVPVEHHGAHHTDVHTNSSTSRAPKTGLTICGFAPPAAIEAKHCFHYSCFSWPLSATSDCSLTVVESLGGAQSYTARGKLLCSSYLPWLFGRGTSLPWDILAEQDVWQKLYAHKWRK